MAPPLPRLQAVRYPANEGDDVVYGLRLTIPDWSNGGGKDWIAEVGKIPDDSLRSHLLGSYVGLADNFYYFKVTSQEETHVFLASLFLADIISRSEAEAVLSKAPTASRLRTTIHRLPSLATLGGAFYSGSYLGTELLSLSPLFSASSFAVAGTPVAFGCLAVGGAMTLFSRSSRGRVGVEMQAGREAESDGGMEMVVWKGERRRVDTSLIQVLRRDELDQNPLFASPARGFSGELARKSILPGVAADDKEGRT